MNFSWALSLDPQGANSMIKEARYVQEEDDEFNASPFDFGETENSIDQDEVMSDLEAQEGAAVNEGSNSSSFV